MTSIPLIRLACLSALMALAGCATPVTVAAPPVSLESVPEYVVPTPAELTATTLQTWNAPEADQGAAVDDQHFYAIDNTVIGKYRLDDGALVARFAAPHKGLIRHMNSCYARRSLLTCANSNYSLTPMGSSIETFDTATMTHVGSHSLGMMDEGSLTWTDETPDGYIAGFAHYSGNGGVTFKDSRFSSVVAFDHQWRRTGGWLIPDPVLERMAPHAASGGALGPDGLLYLLGHDRPEMYVLARPVMGPTLVHVATITLEAEGQAFSFAQDRSMDIFAIDRRKGLVRQIRLPATPDLPAEAKRWTRR